MYESKLQELQKQVETISLVAETPDEEELEEEEEEEGVYHNTYSQTSVCIEARANNNEYVLSHFSV